MRFISTRGECADTGLIDALTRGLAPDGGLFVPASFPRFSAVDFEDADTPAQTAERLLTPFFAGSELASELNGICHDALNFPMPYVDTARDGLSILELFHGPTAAFKDVGARFLAACLSRLPAAETDQLTILVATSGDTGGAVAAAFEGRRVNVGVLFPKGMVSPRQQHQLTCWDRPIAAFSVDGAFDDCQRMVKAAFVDDTLTGALKMTSANSISVGRLLPQTIYYAHTALAQWRASGEPANFIIPTGNLGNALACIWARRMGLPIGRITFATNANRSVPRYLASGRWEPQATVATLASAMDVGNPSNMERLRYLFGDLEELTAVVDAWSVSDEDIRETILWAHDELGMVVCPHTATAIKTWRNMQPTTASCTVVATAHPAKFDEIVEPIVGQAISVPPALAELLNRPTRMSEIAADSGALRSALLAAFSPK